MSGDGETTLSMGGEQLTTMYQLGENISDSYSADKTNTYRTAFDNNNQGVHVQSLYEAYKEARLTPESITSLARRSAEPALVSLDHDKNNNTPSGDAGDLEGEQGIASLTRSFQSAVEVEAKHTPDIDTAALARDIEEIALAGRLPELFSLMSDLAKQPPVRAPKKWDPESGIPPSVAVVETFGHWLARGSFNQSTLRSLDEPLYAAHYSRKRVKKLSEAERKAVAYLEEAMPTLKEFNTRLLSDPDARKSVLTSTRLWRVHSQRGNADRRKSTP